MEISSFDDRYATLACLLAQVGTMLYKAYVPNLSALFQLVSSKIQNEALDLRTSATVGSTKSVGKVDPSI